MTAYITGITLVEDVECPCCEGKRFLVAYEFPSGKHSSHECGHCQGKGTIKIERPMRYRAPETEK